MTEMTDNAKAEVLTDAGLAGEVREWSDLAYEMYALLCSSATDGTSLPIDWQNAFDRLRCRFHAALAKLPTGDPAE